MDDRDRDLGQSMFLTVYVCGRSFVVSLSLRSACSIYNLLLCVATVFCLTDLTQVTCLAVEKVEKDWERAVLNATGKC